MVSIRFLVMFKRHFSNKEFSKYFSNFPFYSCNCKLFFSCWILYTLYKYVIFYIYTFLNVVVFDFNSICAYRVNNIGLILD